MHTTIGLNKVGTIDELFESLLLAQTRKVTAFPIILVGSAYWSGLVQWLRTVVAADAKISAEDLDLIHVTDDPDEVVSLLRAADAARARPNPLPERRTTGSGTDADGI